MEKISAGRSLPLQWANSRVRSDLFRFRVIESGYWWFDRDKKVIKYPSFKYDLLCRDFVFCFFFFWSGRGDGILGELCGSDLNPWAVSSSRLKYLLRSLSVFWGQNLMRSSNTIFNSFLNWFFLIRIFGQLFWGHEFVRFVLVTMFKELLKDVSN